VILDRLLGCVALDVALCERREPSDDIALRRHLHLSLTQRLRIALGEPLALPARAQGHDWEELRRLSHRGQVVLGRHLAVAMWLPVGRVTTLSVTVFHQRSALERRRFDIRAREGDAPESLIPFMMEVGARLWVPPPAELVLPDAETASLRLADQLLHDGAARDDARRRRPAHRDPDEADEDWRLLVTKSVYHRPDMRDGRGWRLNAPASLAQRMREMTG
jgi:hypothetical protein